MWKPIDVITQTKITRSPKPGILYQHCWYKWWEAGVPKRTLRRSETAGWDCWFPTTSVRFWPWAGVCSRWTTALFSGFGVTAHNCEETKAMRFQRW